LAREFKKKPSPPGLFVNLSFFEAIMSPNRMAEKEDRKSKKVPKYPKNSRNEKFSSTGIEDVCLKDEHTVGLKVYS